MKKNNIICLLLCFLFLCSWLLMPVAAEQAYGVENNSPPQEVADASVLDGSHTLNANNAILGSNRLVTNMDAAILYELNTQTLVYAWNPDQKVYPASLVKIMTALLAIENGTMADAVSVSGDIIATVPDDAVSANLKEGELLTLQDLLYCMMVNSANDAAAVIACHISGTQEAFVKEMNRYAQEIGCTGTQFKNPHGLHHEEQYTTARDMAKILEVAMKNEQFVSAFSTIRYTVPATNLSDERKLSSGNYLINVRDNMDIYLDDRVTGGRTGVTDAGGRCLAVSAEKNGLKYISIVMGAKSVYEEDGYTVRSFGGFKETSSLLSFGFDGYKPAQILFANQALKQYDVVNGSNAVVLKPTISVSTVLPEEATLADLTYRYFDLQQEIKAPVATGQQLSVVQVWYNGICVAQADLFAMNAVNENNRLDIDSSSNNQDLWFGILIGVTIVVLCSVLAVFAFRMYRKLRIAASRNRSKRYRRGRRRSR